MKRCLSVHKSLQLTCWVIVLDVLLILSLLFSSFLIGGGDGLVHLGLHLHGLDSGILNGGKIIIFNLYERFLENIWV